MAVDIMTPVARLVGGHPMRTSPVIDDNDVPKLDKLGKPRTSTYIGIAIPKMGETEWKQTAWGAQIVQVAAQDWPRGEHMAPTFAWKITDGDSPIPNKKGIAPNTREGYPGHWVINASTELSVKCYHVGHYAPHEQIQNEKEIKPGDYCRVLLSVKGNGPSESPGLYMNPVLFELTRAGIEIVLSSGPSAMDAFGASAPVLPANAQVDPNVAAPAPMAPPAAPAPVAPPAAPAPMAPPAGIAPAPDFLNPPAPPAAPAPVAERFSYSGAVYTRDQLKASGWQDAQIDALPRA